MSLNPRIYTGKGLIIALIVGFLAVEAIVAGLSQPAHFKTSTNWATKANRSSLNWNG